MILIRGKIRILGHENNTKFHEQIKKSILVRVLSCKFVAKK